ncbi:cell division protein ZapD [Ectothiorhodospiraceae bacterium BW-2]|nr:cell division protein ZapD [Ectothiorhodospiraceae bacterium BW-2]
MSHNAATIRFTTYEHPLGERIRTLLRLEHLFRQAHFFHRECRNGWDSRMLVVSLFELLDLFSRTDLKSEIMKEIDRSIASLQPLIENPRVDTTRLSMTLKLLKRINDNLIETPGQLGQELRDDPFLTSIRQRSTIPGGTCDFDLPAYHQWLEGDPALRLRLQQEWLETLTPIRQAIEGLLQMVRDSATPCAVTAINGQYQQPLDTQHAYQMIRIKLPCCRETLYPEISGSRHRINIRFMQLNQLSLPEPVNLDRQFELSLCLL